MADLAACGALSTLSQAPPPSNPRQTMNEPFDAIIYAAGRSTRMGPAHANSPKILFEVGGKSLLEWHVTQLSAAGVGHLHVVTGHHRDQVRSHIAALQRRHPAIQISEVFNPDFNEGSALSMAASLPFLERERPGILLMDGDVLYSLDLLKALIASPAEATLLLDRGFSTQDDDPVLVPVNNGKPFEFVKKWRGEAEWVGESVGFFKLGASKIPQLVAETLKRTSGLGRSESYDDILRAMVKAGSFDFVDVTAFPWTEIDFPYDLEFARQHVLPQIEAAASKPL